MARSTLIAAALCALVAVAAASEFTSPHIAHLTTSNFEEKTGDGKVYFIKFYAPWCGHCKRLADTWKALGEEFATSDKIAIAHVDCTTDRDVCTNAEIKGYPTLKAFYKGEEIKAYRGARDKDSLKDFITAAANEVTTEA
ncbi:hypothetical protein HYH03_002395 [Edaphochlamys debaryana]|uniref:Thioredoxin domain-containing protein n=1 Tax=Edaphochlamys debaryana TaxID=47281 RepID=A0A835YDW0_9CHLO|nr:hypothetical protein HYH03_002395 [Edaphochlamys debaryana]|eukprot:KAG2499448.1 hypothetical protein HYH03_002395 [Edaphochlamys debaryana]